MVLAIYDKIELRRGVVINVDFYIDSAVLLSFKIIKTVFFSFYL